MLHICLHCKNLIDLILGTRMFIISICYYHYFKKYGTKMTSKLHLKKLWINMKGLNFYLQFLTPSAHIAGSAGCDKSIFCELRWCILEI